MIVGVWLRSAMGLKSSPYNLVQGVLRAKRVIMGDPVDPDKSFQWCSIKENISGSADYDASSLLLTKLRKDGMTTLDITQ